MKKVCKQTYVAKYFYNRYFLTDTEMDIFTYAILLIIETTTIKFTSYY